MNVNCKLITVLLLYCLIFTANAQDSGWQDLVNRKQYAAVIARADSVYSVLLADGDSTYFTLKYGGASKYYAGLYLPSVDILEKAY